MNAIIKRAVINAVGTTVYIILIVSLIFSLQAFSSQPDKTIIIPISMLLLFVCSAAITGFLVFGKPVMLYLDGKKKEAVSLLSYTLGILVVITILSFSSLVAYFTLFR
jgi:hypothetical protein